MEEGGGGGGGGKRLRDEQEEEEVENDGGGGRHAAKEKGTEGEANGVQHVSNENGANGEGKHKKKLEWQQNEYVMLRPLKQSASIDEGGDAPVVWSRIQIASGMKVNGAPGAAGTGTSNGGVAVTPKKQSEKVANGDAAAADVLGGGAANGDTGGGAVATDAVTASAAHQRDASTAAAEAATATAATGAATGVGAAFTTAGDGDGAAPSEAETAAKVTEAGSREEEDHRTNGASTTTTVGAPLVPASTPAAGTVVTSHKGYRMVRATHAIHGNAWYCEVKIVHLGKTGHCRLGFSTVSGELGAPVGYDKHSYGYRDLCGTKVCKAERTTYGEDYYEGDVIGMYIDLPPLPSDAGDERDAKAGEEPELVMWKGGTYIVEKTNNDETVCHEGSAIAFSRNGKSQGVAFRNIMKGSYYAAASLFTLPEQKEGASVQLNAGPNFEYDMLRPEGCAAPRALCELQDDERIRIRIEREAAEKQAAEEAKAAAKRAAEEAEARRVAEEEARRQAVTAMRAAQEAEAKRVAEEEAIQRVEAAMRAAQAAAARKVAEEDAKWQADAGRSIALSAARNQPQPVVETEKAQPTGDTTAVPVAVGVEAETAGAEAVPKPLQRPMSAKTVRSEVSEAAESGRDGVNHQSRTA